MINRVHEGVFKLSNLNYQIWQWLQWELPWTTPSFQDYWPNSMTKCFSINESTIYFCRKWVGKEYNRPALHILRLICLSYHYVMVNIHGNNLWHESKLSKFLTIHEIKQLAWKKLYDWHYMNYMTYILRERKVRVQLTEISIPWLQFKT